MSYLLFRFNHQRQKNLQTMLEDDTVPTVVMDIGSQNLRLGMSGELKPIYSMISAVGRIKYRTAFSHTNYPFIKDYYCGDELQEYRAVSAIKYTMERGTVTNWDDVEKLMHYSFYYYARVAPEENMLLTTKPLLCSKTDQEKMTQIAFETFSVPAFHMATPSELAFSYLQHKTGIILDVGHGLTTTYTKVDGECVFDGIKRQNFGGEDVTTALHVQCAQRGYQFETSEAKEILREIKEKLSAVAYDFDQMMAECSRSANEEKAYQLPDGQVVTIDEQRFRCTEVLFQPELLHKEHLSVVDLVKESINKCSANARNDLYENIILMGGCSQTTGFKERMEKELQADLTNANVKVTLAPENCAWTGGAIYSSLSTFSKIVTSKEEYDECGPPIIHRKNMCW